MFDAEISGYFDALKAQPRFRAADSVKWLPLQTWEEIQGALQVLLDSGFIEIEAAA